MSDYSLKNTEFASLKLTSVAKPEVAVSTDYEELEKKI